MAQIFWKLVDHPRL